MSESEVLDLLRKDDLYGLMLKVTRAWLAKYHPELDSASLIGESGRRLPALEVPIITVSEASGPRLVSHPGPPPS